MKNSGEKKTLLIVDDVELFLQLQISHLGHERYDIHTARSGSDGLRKARSLKPDLILMDLFMPDMDGDKVCRILKGDPETSAIPVVLVSSGTRGMSRTVSESAHCDGLIFKPVRRDLLLSVVENLLGTNLRARDRVHVRLPGSATLDEGEYTVTLHSLSIDGAFVEIARKMIRGDLMELSFLLPGQEEKIHIRTSAVVWCGSLAADGPEGAGVCFLTFDRQTRERIDRFVQDRICSGSAPPDRTTAAGNNAW